MSGEILEGIENFSVGRAVVARPEIWGLEMAKE